MNKVCISILNCHPENKFKFKAFCFKSFCYQIFINFQKKIGGGGQKSQIVVCYVFSSVGSASAW